ncbi:MAG: hypothetical protein KDJ98_15090 [Rhodobacteraceae bacterium]|nr:hypothetical protein [Paracoccaceae bacterium]
MLDFTYNGRRYAGWTFNDAIAAGVPAAVVGAAVKATARALVGDLLDGYRAALSSRSAGKLAEYRVKESLAADPASANTEELALLDREATARGLDRTALLALISAKTTAYRQAALLIGALEAEANAAIAAVSDEASDVETQINTVLNAAETTAATAFAEALTLINGGS